MNPNSIDQEILSKIKERRLEIRSRRSLLTHHVFMAALLVLFCLLIVLTVSFSLYTLHETGVLYLPLLGPHVLWYLLHPFSWFTGMLLTVCVVLVGILGYTLSHRTGAYRLPLVYVWLIAGGVAVVTGAALFATPFNTTLRQYATQSHVPVIEALYTAAVNGMETHTATGIVRETSPDGFELVTVSKKVMTVRMTSTTTIQKGYTIKNNDAVIVVGKSSNGVITADIIHQSPRPLWKEETSELCNLDLTEDSTEQQASVK